MINIKTGTLSASTISANASEGFTVTTKDGKPARLAIIDEQGNIVEAGPQVAAEAWNVCIKAQQNFWKGQGHLRVLSKPGQTAESEAA